MLEKIIPALEMGVRGMTGIFVVLGIIAIVVWLMRIWDINKKNK